MAVTTADITARDERLEAQPAAWEEPDWKELKVEEAAPADTARPILRDIFKYVNKVVMVPIFRLGLGRLVGSPAGGYVMVLKTTGKKSGVTRYAPLNYAILNGNVYCIAGWGRNSHWFANLKADPHVEVLLPGGAVAGTAEEVTEEDEARKARLQVARNAGFAIMFEGVNPFTVTDDQLLEKMVAVPVVRITPAGVGSGPYDAGGWGWVIPLVAQLAGLLWLVSRLSRRARSQK